MKKTFYIGAVAGGILGIVISLSMDLLLGKTLGGGWTEAVAHDLNGLFRMNLPQHHVIVIMGAFVVIGIIAAFGSFIGGVFSVMIARLLHMLTKEK
ncbi:MAG: hypothetical protein HQL08_09695 [Nitrospirae bacterium]|nr:hypothetical protein [Nitrospirota bacterium]